MSTPTPPEQAITHAIDEALSQYYRDNPARHTSMPGGWVLLINDIGLDANETSGIQLVYPNGTMPWINALGIIEAARIVMHARFAEDE